MDGKYVPVYSRIRLRWGKNKEREISETKEEENQCDRESENRESRTGKEKSMKINLRENEEIARVHGTSNKLLQKSRILKKLIATETRELMQQMCISHSSRLP